MDLNQAGEAEETHRSVSWVKKWRRRLEQADLADQEVLRSLSRRLKQAGSLLEPKVVEWILS